MRKEDEGVVIVDEARGVGLGLGKERGKWEPDEAFSVDTLTRVLLYIPAHLHHASKHARQCVSQRTACVFAVAFCTIHSIRLLHTGVTPSTPYTILIMWWIKVLGGGGGFEFCGREGFLVKVCGRVRSRLCMGVRR